jgi:cytochrome P450
MEPHFEWWEEAGDVDLIHYTGLLGHSSILILNADFIKQVLMANYRTPRYVKKFFNLERMLGKGLVTLEGEDWHRHRRIIHPSFQVGFLKASLDQHVPSRVTQLLECWKQAGSDRVIDVSAHFSMLTLDIIGEVAFAHDFCGLMAIEEWAQNKDTTQANVDELPQVSDRLVKSMNASMRATPKRVLLSVFGLDILDREAARTRKAMNDAVAQVVDDARLRYETRGRTSATSSNGKYAAKSVLEVLLDANDAEEKDGRKGKLDSKELQDEVKTFLVAGHETTSTWCYWATYCLCQHPEIQERVYQDIIKHAPIKEGGGSDTSSEIDVETAEKMTYLDAFLKEVLRLYAPAGMIIRNNVNEETYGDSIIPADTRLLIPIYLVHRSPRYWKNPDDFQPERWLGEEPPYSHSYAFLPFSHGPRNCIGYRFATMEAKLIMAPILRRVRFELIPEIRNSEFKLTSYITVKAKPGVKVNAKFRE